MGESDRYAVCCIIRPPSADGDAASCPIVKVACDSLYQTPELYAADTDQPVGDRNVPSGLLYSNTIASGRQMGEANFKAGRHNCGSQDVFTAQAPGKLLADMIGAELRGGIRGWVHTVVDGCMRILRGGGLHTGARDQGDSCRGAGHSGSA